jgi:hypothetical protein
MKNKTLTYWKAECIDDNDCFSLRHDTKREVLAELKSEGLTLITDTYGDKVWADNGSPRFMRPEKITVTYTTRIDLVQQLCGEGTSSY